MLCDCGTDNLLPPPGIEEIPMGIPLQDQGVPTQKMIVAFHVFTWKSHVSGWAGGLLVGVLVGLGIGLYLNSL